MFLQASVILLTGGGAWSRGLVLGGGVCSRGVLPGGDLPPGRPLLRVVHILLECILVVT